MSGHIAHDEMAASLIDSSTQSATTPKRYSGRSRFSNSQPYDRSGSRASISSQDTVRTLVASPRSGASSSFKNRDSMQSTLSHIDEADSGDQRHTSTAGLEKITEAGYEHSASTRGASMDVASSQVWAYEEGKFTDGYTQGEAHELAEVNTKDRSLPSQENLPIANSDDPSNDDVHTICGMPISLVNVSCFILVVVAAIFTGIAIAQDNRSTWGMVIGSIMFLGQLLHVCMDLRTCNKRAKKAIKYQYIMGIATMVPFLLAAITCFVLYKVKNIEIAGRLCEAFLVWINIVFLLMANVRRSYKEHKRADISLV